MGTLWDKLLNRFEKFGSCDVTHRNLILGTRDSETGWREPSYSESTIKMILIPRAATSMALQAGTYVRLDAVGLTNFLCKEGDEIKVGITYYKVKAVRNHSITPDTVEYYECDLSKMPLHG